MRCKPALYATTPTPLVTIHYIRQRRALNDIGADADEVAEPQVRTAHGTAECLLQGFEGQARLSKVESYIYGCTTQHSAIYAYSTYYGLYSQYG